MGHDIHFLDRTVDVTRNLSLPVLERAMLLYHDPELVRFILEKARAPEALDAAIALEASAKPAHLVVRRDGSFKTILDGEKVVKHATMLSFQHFEVITEKMADLRERLAVAERLTGSRSSAAPLLKLLTTAGRELSREEFVGVSAWQPLMQKELHALYKLTGVNLDTLRQRLRHIRRVERNLIESLRSYWNGYWLLQHLGLLFPMEGREFVEHSGVAPERRFDEFSLLLSHQGLVSALLRGAWVAGKLGKPMLVALKQELALARRGGELLRLVGGLLAIAARHRGLRAEAQKALKSAFAGIVEFERQQAQAELLPFFDSLFELLEQPDDARGAWLDRAGAEFQSLLSTDASSDYRYRVPDDVPAELAAPAAASSIQAVNSDVGHLLYFLSIPNVASFEPEQFYFPKEVIKELYLAWRPEDTVTLLQRQDAFIPKQAPTRAAPRPGPNQLCPCGSQKKYKKCHGA